FNKGVAIFSLEMSNMQLVQRIISMESEISGQKLRNGNVEEYEWQQIQTAIERMSELPIYIDDTPGINIFELRAKCRRLKMQHDIQLIIIDYLQLMSGGSGNQKGNREQEVSAISRSLKGLAKELEVPVIALSQLSRAVETRGGTKRPQLSDLRESGSIEQDADMVAFIYRPEYYQILEDEEGHSLKGIAEIIFAKNRHGSTETIKLKFQGEFARFSDLDDFSMDDITGSGSNLALNSNSFGDNNIIKLSSRMNSEEAAPPFAENLDFDTGPDATSSRTAPQPLSSQRQSNLSNDAQFHPEQNESASSTELYYQKDTPTYEQSTDDKDDQPFDEEDIPF
ncbi:MAG: DnaB-like helicase C-terminal domain-containing protein, partial [Bacteroidota bacterium]